MTDERLVRIFFKSRFYKGRTMVSRAVDFVAFRLILFLACYFYFSSCLEGTALALAVSIAATLALIVALELIRSIRYERFLKAELERERKRLFASKLTRLTQAQFLLVIREYLSAKRESIPKGALVATVQTVSPVTADAVLAVCRRARAKDAKGVLIFATAEASAEACTAAHSEEELEGTEVLIVTPKELMHSLGERAFPTDEAVEGAIAAEMRRERAERKERRETPFRQSRMKRYFIIAAILFALSFFVEYQTYYRLLASACLSLGMMAWWMEVATQATPEHTL